MMNSEFPVIFRAVWRVLGDDLQAGGTAFPLQFRSNDRSSRVDG